MAGALADCGYGVIENVVADVDIDVSVLDMATAGGLVGSMQDGELIFRNCVNIGNVSAGRYGAGIVGLAYAAGSYDLIAEQCVNYGRKRKKTRLPTTPMSPNRPNRKPKMQPSRYRPLLRFRIRPRMAALPYWGVLRR